MEIQELFKQRCLGEAGAGHKDMLPHMEQIRDLAALCSHCTEFGVRTGQSTVAILAGLNGRGPLHSYDVNPPEFQLACENWHFHKGRTNEITAMEETDLLFVDTIHHADQVRAELNVAEPVVKRFIVFHDVIVNGWAGENSQPGILNAIFEFMAGKNWRVREFHPSNWGLLVIERT